MEVANTSISNMAYNSITKYNSTDDITQYAPLAMMNKTHQTLMNTKVTQVGDRKPIVSFSKYLKEEGKNEILANEENTFLWAVGRSNDLDIGRSIGVRAHRGHFDIGGFYGTRGDCEESCHVDLYHGLQWWHGGRYCGGGW